MLGEKLVDKLFFVVTGYLDDKDILPIVQKIINPLLTINVSSYLFERFYFKYHWLDVTDYKSILTFFIKGGFVIPISLFIVVHFFFFFITNTAFYGVNKLIDRVLKKADFPEEEKFRYYKVIKANEKNFNKKKLAVLLPKAKIELREKVLLLLKIMIVSTLYFVILPSFGTILFVILLLILLILLLFYWMIYLLFDLVPPAIKKLLSEEERLLQEHKSSI